MYAVSSLNTVLNCLSFFYIYSLLCILTYRFRDIIGCLKT